MTAQPDSTAPELLRFNTCGSVDDGKSTLIGRLLYDSKSLMEDQVADLEHSADLTGGGQVNLANLTDGLRAEREQGITIDVAYRYFATPRRRFILADTPGHRQYTRNMVTGASTAQLSIVLVDARHGLTEQTRRHMGIAALLRVPHLVVAVNKMDLVDWSAARFAELQAEFAALPAHLGLAGATFIPLSALLGDNVVTRSPHTPWHGGPPLLEHLETVAVPAPAGPEDPFRLPVQWVNRPHLPTHPQLRDFRGVSGRLAGGRVRPGQEIQVLPGGQRSTVREIWTGDGPVAEADAPQSVTLVLADDLDIGRGDLLVSPGSAPRSSAEPAADLCWLHPTPLAVGKKYWLKHHARTLPVIVSSLTGRLEPATFTTEPAPQALAMNDLGRVTLRTAQPVHYDDYARNRTLGGFILIDPATHATVAAGMFDGDGAGRPD